ncbi:sulfate transporter 3.5 [Carex littledalei]|uniref:Sulfate transporter 3.5 n=1 Tax=Carex littledalei TaxID=544730 RepID=A0A833QKR8_9POAL|nr:sulfate transporter 3.5 [Carex littledalei]
MGTIANHPKVNLTKNRTFGQAIGSDLKETFFPDNPFGGFKKLSPGLRVWYCLQYYIPILEWGPKYTFSYFRSDLLAGLTIASLAIPQGISYARLAGLPPIIGLYSSFVPPLIYAVFGSSKNLAVGTVAAASLLLASLIQSGDDITYAANPELYINLFFTAAFFTGVMQAALGFLRLGILIDFLSRSTITGFMGGTACIIILQQMKGMLGMTHFTTKTDLISVLHAIFHNRHEWKWQSFVLGICFLLFLLLSKHLKEKMPKLFWVSAIAPLLVVVLGGLFAFLVKGEDHGIPIVGELKKGLNPISIGHLTFQGKHLSVALKAGVLSGFLALAEGIAVGRSLAMLKDEQIDGNKEMIAYGLMNIAGSFTSCYLTTGPFSKSAVNYHAGCKTQFSNVVMSICIMLVLLFLAPLFKFTPLVALSTIIIVAMIGLIEIHEFKRLFKVDKFDFIVCMSAFIGVLMFTMVIGLSVSVGLSLIRALIYVARPKTCKLGNIPGTDLYRDVKQYTGTSDMPGVLVLQLGSPIYFANAGYLRERISRWVENEPNNRGDKNDEDLQFVVLEMGGVTAIDNSGIGMLFEVQKILEKKGIKIAMTNPRQEVVEKLVAAEFVKSLGEEWIFVSIKDAIYAWSYKLQESSNKTEEV